jgi:hypothetical protein
MPITFNCPHCRSGITTSDAGAGQQGKCPACGETVVSPGLVTVPTFVLAQQLSSTSKQQARTCRPYPMEERPLPVIWWVY